MNIAAKAKRLLRFTASDPAMAGQLCLMQPELPDQGGRVRGRGRGGNRLISRARWTSMPVSQGGVYRLRLPGGWPGRQGLVRLAQPVPPRLSTGSG